MLIDLPVGGRPSDEDTAGASERAESLSIWILDDLDERSFEILGHLRLCGTISTCGLVLRG
jgi:hypothetical protein